MCCKPKERKEFELIYKFIKRKDFNYKQYYLDNKEELENEIFIESDIYNLDFVCSSIYIKSKAVM